MKEGLYVIYDKVAEECGPVIQAVNDGVARRFAFQALKNVPDYDRDAFALYRVGYVETEDGKVTGHDSKVVVDLDIPKVTDVEARDFGMEAKANDEG